jgi:hypothetical protein
MKWLVALAAITAATPTIAQKPKAEVREVKAIGCVRKAVGSGCLLLRTLDGQTTYSIFALTPPEPGIVIMIEGKPHNAPTSCTQGIPIDVTDWEETGEKCSR